MIPEKPGVYIFQKNGTPIYIGKAKNLRKRVSSYFSKNASQKSHRIVDEANDLEYVTLFNEREALLMEANLIYSYKPHFNVLLKDSRAYPYIEFMGEEFPYVKITHKKSPNSFGPFTSVRFLRELLNLVQPIFQLRSCTFDFSKVKSPCFEYHIKRCLAPCVELVSYQEYDKRVEMMKKLLSGDTKFVKKWIEERIEMYAHREMFESAQTLKNLYIRLNDFLIKQSVEFQKPIDVDAFEVQNGGAILIKVRRGMMLTKLEFEFDGDHKRFVERYYLGRGEIPPQLVLVPKEFRGIKKWSKRISSNIKVPEDENEKAIISMVKRSLDEYLRSKYRKIHALEMTKLKLKLSKLPLLIEGIDISHTSGTLTVASVVAFVEGTANKKKYRRYNLSSFSKPDDFEAMRKVIKRRYTHNRLPDLLLIDGGKGQVNAVKMALHTIGIVDANVVGLAKEDERIVFPGERKDLHLSLNDDVLRLMIAIRDESHRFATSYHYLLRDKKMTFSFLDSVVGIGPKRKKSLLKSFKSLNSIRDASYEELKQIVGEKIAKKIEEKLTLQDNS